MHADLTHGPISRGLIRFSLPLMAGNLLQQLYTLVDTYVVGRYCGQTPLAAVGSAFSVMILLTSILTGLCMGSGVVVSQLFGQNDKPGIRKAVGNAFVLIGGIAVLLVGLSYLLLPQMMVLLRIPEAAQGDLRCYLLIVFAGLLPTCLYHFASGMLRAVGNSVTPLLFLLFSSLTNVALDFWFVAICSWGVAGAAWATLLSQVLCAIACGLYLLHSPLLRPSRQDFRPDGQLFRRILSVSALSSIQQSIMNFGILCVQSLVNSFGLAAMAAFAAGVKIDSLAYSPAQDFGNGFATFVAQNQGAHQPDRLRKGIRTAFLLSGSFCVTVSVLVAVLARPLLLIFLENASPEALAIGVTYLRTEGLCYIGIGFLFLLYATFRGLEQAGMSIVLTVISLGLRVALSYAFAPRFGMMAIWLSIPAGWLVADAVGLLALLRRGLLRVRA